MKKKTATPAARRRAPAPLPVDPQLLMLGILIDGPGGSTSQFPHYIATKLQDALEEADAQLRLSLGGDDEAWECNHASSSVQAQVRKTDAAEAYNVLLEIDDEKIRVHVEDALDKVGLEASEAGIWLGMALAYRYFGMGGGR